MRTVTVSLVFAHSVVGALALYIFLVALPVEAASLKSPLADTSIAGFIQSVLKAVVAIALPVVSFFIVYSGFRFILAQGNDDKLTKAKANFTWLIVGTLLILGAWAIAVLLTGTVQDIIR